DPPTARAVPGLRPNRISSVNGLPVQREIEILALHLVAHAQPDEDVDDLEDDQRHDGVVDEDDAFDLVDHLHGVARSRAKSRFAQPCAATNQVPCQFAPSAVKCLETRSVCGAAATCLRPFVKRRTNPAQVCSIFDQEVRRDRMPRPRASMFSGAPEGYCRRALCAYCSASPCWVRSRPSISCCSLTRRGRRTPIALRRM